MLLCALMVVGVFAGCTGDGGTETDAPETDAPAAKLAAEWIHATDEAGNVIDAGAGVAAGAIKIFSESTSGNITVKWGANGTPIEGYSAIGSGLMRKNVETVIEFSQNALIPVGANQILVYLANVSTEVPEAVIDIAPEKQSGQAGTAPKYTVGIISDVLCDGEKYAKALTYFKNAGVSAVIVIGDFASSWEAWENTDENGAALSAEKTGEMLACIEAAKSVTDGWNVPIYYVRGENDKAIADETLFGAFTYAEGDATLYYRAEIGGDLFLFVGSENVPTRKIYNSEAQKFLRNQLKDNEDRNIYLVTQFPLKETAGNITYGDDYLYPSEELASTADSQIRRYLKSYSNLVHISAETGFSYTLIQYDKSLVCSDANGENAALSLHIPALTPITNSGTNIGTPDPFLTEGAILAVYDGHAELLAVDMEADEYISNACVYIDKTPVAE